VEENLRTKQIESIIKTELENWLVWGKKRDWLPVSFKCVLGTLYIRPRIPIGDERYDTTYTPPIIPTESSAADFERIVIKLPERHKKAFVAHHLEKAVVDGKMIKLPQRDAKAKILGVGKSQYHDLVNQAHVMVLREWRKIFVKNS